MLKYLTGSHYNERVGCSSGEILQRLFRIFRLDPHPKKKLLIVRGELTIQITNGDGSELLGEETRDFKKVIRLEGLRESTNVDKVVEDIRERCPYIDGRFEEYLYSVVEVIKNRTYDEHGEALPDKEGWEDDASEGFPDGFDDDDGGDYDEDQEGAEMTSLELYIELLYEELPDKVKGARFISKLAKMPENLVAIADHETALNALFRTLREDYKKSLDLTTNILQVCFYYSQFEDFHDMLISNKICSITFDILEFEMTRNEKWKEEVLHRQKQAQEPDASSKAKHNFEKLMAKYSEISRKQDSLLRVAFDVVFRLYEHPDLQPEILKRGIVAYLMEALERRNVDLLLLVVDFLKTLSILLTCKTAMNQLQVLEKIIVLVDANFPNDLISLSLRLLYNLSFDTKMRHRMVKQGLLQKLAHFLSDPELEPVCLNILYVMSMDRRIRPKLSLTNVVPVVMKLLTEPSEETLSVEARALAINLAHTKRSSVAMCASNGVPNLLSKAFENEDPLLMKVIRNIAKHEGATKELFIEYISDLASAITKVGARDFALECVGTLGHLTIPDLDYAKLLKEFGLIPWVKSVLMNPKNNSHSASKRDGKISLLDVLCTVIYFLGTCAGDGECAEYLVAEGVADLVLKNFNNRGDRPIDMDIKCHILYFFYKLSSHRKTRAYLVEKTRVPQMLLDLLHESNKQVRDISSATLELIGGYSEVWEARVKKERFAIHNETWIDMVDKLTRDPMYQADLELTATLGYPDKRPGDKLVLEMTASSSAETSDTIGSGSEHSDSDEWAEGDNTEERKERKNRRKSGRSGDERPAGPGDDDDEDPDQGHRPSIFDQFRDQFEYEMDRKERWEYGITDEDDDEDDDERNVQLLPHPHSLAYRIASAAGPSTVTRYGSHTLSRGDSDKSASFSLADMSPEDGNGRSRLALAGGFSKLTSLEFPNSGALEARSRPRTSASNSVGVIDSDKPVKSQAGTARTANQARRRPSTSKNVNTE